MILFKRNTILIALTSLLLCVSCSTEPDQTNDLSKNYEKKKGSYPIVTRHLTQDNEPEYINRLILQDSLYLLQHAHNPVDWWSWGDDAFTAAREADKPILLSIGYSTCHWCHVMERESFENIEIAEYINQNFIAIKVDREEHPDIDEVYLTAVQMLSGQAGGWPLTAILTPDALPFFGGTYFQPKQFLSLLKQVNDTWQQKRPAVLAQAERLKKALSSINQSASAAKAIDNTVITLAQKQIQQDLSTPSRSHVAAFPREPEILFLLHQALAKLETDPLTIAQKRLHTIAAGGIHDQLGGGFHRYSVDASWKVPHFEKMLYNQAQLARAYAETYKLSHNPQMRRVAEATFDFMLKDMMAPEGGFYAAMDAESDGQEGSYYLWRFDELSKLLDTADLELAKTAFGISENGNFSGFNVLQGINPETSAPLSNEVENQLNALKNTLSKTRKKRPHPRIDTKIITAWNGLSISALISGYQTLGHEKYRAAATKAAQRIWDSAYSNKQGLARTIPVDNTVVDGTLEDYAYFANALLDIHDLTNNSIWLERTQELTSLMIDRFHDEKTGGFFINNSQAPKGLIVSLVTARDNSIVSGNSIAAQVLVKLFARTGKLEYQQLARSVIAAFSKQMFANPQSLSGMLTAASLLNYGEIGSTQYSGKGKVRIETSVINQKLIIKADIADGWHINSYRVLSDYLIPTTLKSSKGHCSALKNIAFPDDKTVTLGFQKDELQVYEDQMIISAEINPSSNCHIVAAELNIQACSDKVCLSPETLQIRTPVTTR